MAQALRCQAVSTPNENVLQHNYSQCPLAGCKHQQLKSLNAGRGTFTIKGSDHEDGLHGHLPDTFVSVRGWGKGLAWINGHNLGWYWASIGPQVSFSPRWCMSGTGYLP